MSGWLRDSQAHIVFWFGFSLAFGMTRRIVRVIVPGRWLPGNLVFFTWRSSCLGEKRAIVRVMPRRRYWCSGLSLRGSAYSTCCAPFFCPSSYILIIYPAGFYTGKKITRTIVRQYPGTPVGIRGSGFGVSGSGIGIGDRDICIYTLIYIYIIYNFFLFF